MKMISVQNITPPLGERRFTRPPSSWASSGEADASTSASERERVRIGGVTKSRRRERAGGAGVTPPAAHSELVLDDERDDDAEERDALDEGGENQGRRLDAPGRFRLPRHRLGHRAADAADADAGADRREARAD